jgi:tetratricopeptide (TPR) repeat protein
LANSSNLKNVPGSAKGSSGLTDRRVTALIRSHPFAWFALAAACWTLFLYRHAMSGGFVYDDFPQIKDNPALLSWHSVLGYFRSAVPFSSAYLTTGGSFYRPLLWASLALDRRLWGLNTAAFHATNLALHFCNSLLLFLILRRTRTSIWLCAGICLVWLGLPINSEAVAWISGRYIELFALFVLLGLWQADIYAESKSTLILSCYVLSGLAAMLSYEAGILLFPLAALWLYFRAEHARVVWLRLGIASAIVCIAGLIMRSAAGAQLPEGSIRIFTVGISFFKYLAWMLAPIHMSIERSTDLAPDRLSIASVLAMAALALLVAATTYFRRKLPDIALGIAWLLVTLLPFCGIVPNYQGMAERYLYLPSIGTVFLLVALSRRLKGLPGSWCVGVIAIWVFWGAWRLNARVLDWKDEVTLDLASLRATPGSPVLLYNLGVAKTKTGDVRGAIDYYRKAIAANPRYSSALLNLSSLLRAQGELTEALRICRQAAEMDPKNSGVWINLGNIYGQLGSVEQAKNSYERAVALDPRNAEAVVNLGTAYQRLGNLEAARQQYEFAISLNPSQAAAYCDLGALLFQQGDTERAVHVLNKAIEIDPSYPTAYFDLGVLYQQRQMYVLAREMYGKTLELDPHHEAARRNLESIRHKE